MTMENKPLLQVKDLTVTFGERHNKFTAQAVTFIKDNG